jgi:aminomethyltransferase
MIEISGVPTFATQYAQADSAVLIVRHPDPGLLRVSGEDRLDLLNRMSTNQLLNLTPGTSATTVFTTPIGRIVEVARVLSQPEQALLLTAPGRAAPLRDWLQRHIFFQDKVTLGELTGPWSHWGVYGPQALERARILVPELPALDPGAHAELPGGVACSVLQPRPGLEFVLQGEATQRAEASWPTGAVEQQAYEALRIEAGLPTAGREITSEAIPLEVGLWEAVSFSKGCYIGQEIIARMESRGRQARQLVGVRLEQPAQAGAPLRQGEMLQGSLTSVAESPRLGWIGLAVVRPAALSEAGGRVGVGEDGAAGQLVGLPFA